jgi:predicted transposase/invertase (TIGR01784 family)
VSPLEEWLQYLKDEYIKHDTKVPGLMEARERLEYLRMTPEERRDYDNYLDNLVRDTDVMKTKLLEARIEGEKQGRAAGRAEGRAEGIVSVARNMKLSGMAENQIAQMTGLSLQEIAKL